MTRNMKALGLALLAVFAISAAIAQGAVAHVFKASQAPADITGTNAGEGEHVFSSGALTVKCATAKFTGTQAETPTNTVTVTPEYTNCKLGESNVTVKDNGCKYEFGGATTADPKKATEGESAAVKLNCEMTGNITIEGPGCNIIFEDTHGVGNEVNQALHGIKYTNITENSKEAVTVAAKVHNIAYTTKGSFCFLVGKEDGGTYTDGKYEGNAVVTGYKDGSEHNTTNQIDVTIE